MKLKDLLQKLNDLVTADATTADKDAVEVIHSAAPAEVFQIIFDRGHSTGLTKGTGKVTEAETKYNTEKARADEAARQLDEFKAKHPDAAKLQEGYQRDLETKDREHAEALRLKDVQIETERAARARAIFVGELKDLGVDKDYAEVLADKAEHKDRIKFNDKGEPEVLQKGKDIAIVPTAEKGALGMLASEILPLVPAKFVTSKAAGGGGLKEERGGGGGDTSKAGAKPFEDIRKKEQERAKSAGPATSTAADRLAGRKVSTP